MPTLILDLSAVEATLERAGGKGANLARLMQGGWRVPPGFIVTTDAYREFVATHGLQARILAQAAAYSAGARSVPGGALENLDSASAEIRKLFDEYPMPRELADGIAAAFRQLDTTTPPAVAVRSSATAEDLPGLAFAGQQETYLNVIGESALLDAVKKCWGSLWTARAMAYRARNNVPSDEVALAVVVQRMVASECSGVMFTANPVTGRRDEIIVDASFGLGEAIVSGQVEPDHYVVRSTDWQIVECTLGAKALAIVPAAGGGTAQVELDLNAREQALADAQILELAHIGNDIAARFGSPQDIEWAFAGGQLYIVQARPITSLYPIPANPFPDPGLRVYFSFNSVQGVADPITPLGANALQALFAGGVVNLLALKADARDYLQSAGGRLYVDVTDLARDPRLRNVLMAVFERGDPGAQATFRRLIDAGRVPLVPILTPRILLHVLSHAAPLIRGIVGALRSPERGVRTTTTGLAQVVANARAEVRAATDLAARVRALRTGMPRHFSHVLVAGVPAIAPMMVGLVFTDRWLVEWLGEPRGTALKLLRGLPGNVTTQMDLALWRVAQTILADAAATEELKRQPPEVLAQAFQDGVLPPVAQAGIARFLDEYGMRAVTEIDLGRPRWRDDPAPVLAMLLSYLQLDDPEVAPDVVFERGRAASEALAAELAGRIRRTRFGAVRARLFGAAVRRMRLLGGLREMPKLRMVQVLDLYRTGLLASAAELVARGALECAEDVFFVPLDELERFARDQAVDLKSVVKAERANYEREMLQRQFPRILLSTGEAFYEGVSGGETGGAELAGQAVSPGVVEGRVQVVLDPRDAKLMPGDILVCPATDPGWTPLFMVAGGLVMEVGGMITHGSVVAREYGIPAVVGIQNVTTRLQSGQRVRVDGNSGRVTLL